MIEFHDLDFYLLRSPKVSLDKIEKLLSIREKSLLEQFLRSFYTQEFMKQAIFLASESLYIEVEKWLSKEKPLSEKLAKTLYKYAVRISSRCTPYGHFAGVGIGEILATQNNMIDIRRNQKDTVRYRLNMQFLFQIMQHISKDPDLRNKLIFSLNGTLYQQGKHYKFYQQIPDIDSNKYYLSQTPVTQILDYIIKEKENSKTYRDWTSLIRSKGAEEDQANKFVARLIDNQILTSEMHPQLTVEDNFYEILKTLEAVDKKNIYFPTLNKVNKLLNSSYSLIERQKRIEPIIKRKFQDTKIKNLLQGDLRLGTETNFIPKNTIKLILSQLEELIPLTNSTHTKKLEQFKKSFISKYDGQMVKLVEALDPDTGVGYTTNSVTYSSQDSLLNGIKPKSFPQEQNINNPLEDLVYTRYHMNPEKKNSREVRLQESDLHNLKNKGKEQTSSPSLYAIGNLLLENNTTTPIFCLQAYGGTSAGNLITRFGYLDKKLHDKLEELGNTEQKFYHDAIIAEIIHLPESRTGNIIQRPNIRKAEIVLMAKANKKVISINVNELYLFVQKNRLVLWSKKLQKEIIPRLTSAHNYQNGFTLYHFLSDLQFQDHPMSVKWQWVKLGKLPFLPRIRYKNLILSRAKWNISKIKEVPNDSKEKKTRMAWLSNVYDLPNKVVLVEGDNELLLDLSNPIAIDIFFDKASKQDITLNEFIFSEYKSPIKDIEGNLYTNELVIPIVMDIKRKSTNIVHKFTDKQRLYILGNEWIYMKIYCGIHCAENLLKDAIPEMIQTLKDKSLLKKWFFIRYKDPEHHLRLRFEVSSPDKFESIIRLINELLAPKLSDNIISNIQFDTYRRELERYTPEYIELSEEFFYKDSEFVLSTIIQIPIPSDRWSICLYYMDSLLNYADLTLMEKFAFSKQMRLAFADEFGNNKPYEKKLNQIFRKRKAHIERYLSTELSNKNMIHSLQHFQAISDIIECEKISADAILNKKTSLISSYIHMFINRLLPSEQRQYEYAFYHLLDSYYQMLIGKRKSLSKKQSKD